MAPLDEWRRADDQSCPMPTIDRLGARLLYSRSGSGPAVLLVANGVTIQRAAMTTGVFADHFTSAEMPGSRLTR